MDKVHEVAVALILSAVLIVVASVVVFVVPVQRTCEHTSVERNSQGQRLDFDRCATILQWTEECLP